MPTVCDVDSPLRVSEETARQLASTFGTPLYVLSEAHFRHRIRRYKRAFSAAYSKVGLSYASKANSTLALLAIAHAEGLLVDVASEGELRAALAAGVPANRCEFHGNNKSLAELQLALESGIRTIVADNFEELENLHFLWSDNFETKVVLRLAPGVDPITHHHISTGQEDTKFGFNVANGSAEMAVQRSFELGLPLIGFHCHVGSQLIDPEAQQSGGEVLAEFAVAMKHKHGFAAQVLNVGGGLGVAYRHDSQPLDLEDYCKLVVSSITRVLDNGGLDPVLMQEPGRSLVAEAGCTLYTVGVVKDVPVAGGTKTYVTVDGGLSDNPRPALYGANYLVERASPVDSEAENVRVTVSGKHCETDTLFPNVELPGDIKPGDILQVLSTGAYNSSMASNYNRFPKPAAVLLCENGEAALVQRRETWDELFGRESLPPLINRP